MARVLVASFSVCPGTDRHGAEVESLARALTPRVEVDVVTLRLGDLPYVDRLGGARMLRVPVGVGSLGERAERFGRALRRQAGSEDYDVVHLLTSWGAREVLPHLSATTRLVFDLTGAQDPMAQTEEARGMLADDQEACLERAALVLAPSEAARLYVASCGLGERVVVVRPGVNLDAFDWQPPLEDIRRWMIDDPGPIGGAMVLCAGRLAEECGTPMLLRAFAQARAGREAHLVLAGPLEPGYRQGFERDLREIGEARNAVHRLGPVQHEEMPRVLGHATIVVVPVAPNPELTPLTGLPLTLLEAMACRKPVIAPRRPGIVDWLRDGSEGLLFSPGVVEELAADLRQLLDDAPLRARLGDRSYHLVRGSFSAAGTRRALLEAYTRVIPPERWSRPRGGPEAETAQHAAPDDEEPWDEMATPAPTGARDEGVVTAPLPRVDLGSGSGTT